MITVSITSDADEIGTQYCYRAWVTRAPQVYDASTTITMYENNGERIVLIEESQLEWHRGRYGSGLYGLEPSDCPESEFVRHLIDRVFVEAK